GSDASWRVIDTHYRTCRCGLRQLVDGSPPAAPHIEDGEVCCDPHLCKAPVRQSGMRPVHQRGEQSADPTGGFSDLRERHVGCGYAQYQSRDDAEEASMPKNLL